MYKLVSSVLFVGSYVLFCGYLSRCILDETLSRESAKSDSSMNRIRLFIHF